MKQTLIAIVYLFLLTNVFGQNNFSILYGGQNSQRPICIKEIETSYYFTSCDFILPEYTGHSGEIVKIDSVGKILKKVQFHTEGLLSGPIRNIFPINSSQFLLFGGNRQDENDNTSIWIIKMDTSLNIIWDKKFPTDGKYLERISYTLNDSDNLVLAATLTSASPDFHKSILFLELTMEGYLIRSRHETTGNPVATMGYSIISHNKGYYAFVDGFASYMPIPITSPAQRLDIDTNFNITQVHTLPNGIDQYMTALKINEQSYYLTGSVYCAGFYHEIGIQKTDTSNIVLESNHSGLPGDIPDGPAWLDCMAMGDNNNIYTGGVGYSVSSFSECNLLQPKVFILSNYDSLLNCRWTRYYGSDTACYYMMTLDATGDGGCIMAGTILAPDNGQNQTDVIIIKVDSEGLITSSNKPGTRVMNAMVYPNPGQDYLMLQTGPQNAGAIFTLTNLSGQKVIEYTVNSTIQQISTHSLPSGVFIWILDKGNSLIESGKWIKQ